MKLSRIRKVTYRLIGVYAIVLVLVAFANPEPEKHWFWIGLGLILPGELLRIWACGHLIKNKRLTTTGPYAYVKNPLYVGTFLIMVGFCLLAQGKGRYAESHWYFNHMNLILLGVGILGFIARYAPYKKKREGDRMRDNFGEDWDLYDRNVPDYFPRLTPWVHPNGESVKFSFKTVCDNSEQWTPLSIVAGVVAMIYNQHLLDFFGNLF